jgi:hypothetical protein
MFCLERLHYNDELCIKKTSAKKALTIKRNNGLSGETQHITLLSSLTKPPKHFQQIYRHIIKPSAPFIYPTQLRLIISHITMERGGDNNALTSSLL